MKRGKLADFRPDQEVVWLHGDVYADRDEWRAEQERNRKPPAEMLAEAIVEALARGVDRARVRRVVEGVFRQGGEGELTELVAASRIGKLATTPHGR